MIINVYNYLDAIPLLLKNDKTFERLKVDFPEILADLITFRNNPNCSCRGRVFKFFFDKLTSIPDILDKYIDNYNSFNEELITTSHNRLSTTYSGKIFSVPKGEEAWQNFAKSLIGKVFHTFSIVEKEDSLTVYFL